MNWALISFGARSDALAALATAAAHELGPVTIDHGDTACKTPDAAAYIARARQHRAKQQAKAAKKPARAKKPAAKRSPAKALS